MADANEYISVLNKTVTEFAIDVDREVIDRLARLYVLHEKYRTRAVLSARMDVYGYLGEFILDIFELEAAGKSVDTKNWCDIGSGGGYPGLPLAILKPGSSFTLLESSRKKAEYLHIAVNELSLGNVKVVCSRAEDYSGNFDTLTCKGLNLDFDTVLNPLLRRGGKAYIFRDTSGEEGPAAEVFSYINRWNGRERDISIISK